MKKLFFAFALIGLAGTARAANPPEPPRDIQPTPPAPLQSDGPPSTPEPLTVSALVFGSASLMAWKLRRRKE
jgi:hypothetical protein